jgi:hypothetical protein
METLALWKTILMSDLYVLTQLEEQDEVSQMRHAMKEQEIGQHCCQAGEDLTDEELALLKRALELSEQQWYTYKSKVRPAPE